MHETRGHEVNVAMVFVGRTALLTLAIAQVLGVGCSSSAGSVFGGARDASGDALGDATATTTAGGPDAMPVEAASESGASGRTCTSTAQCNDGVACTVDTCTSGTCAHAANSAACPAGSFCEPLTGCNASVACTTTDQCVQKLGSDACKTQLACDAALAVCTYRVLDKDGDGHPPAVCGGDDCDDTDPTRYGGAAEVCDGKDNNCNGIVDDNATCPGGGRCSAGKCMAPTGGCNVALFVMADTSGSTGSTLGDAGSQTRIAAMTQAIGAFIDEPASAGLGFGLGHNPRMPADAGAGCAPGTQCGSGGTCCPGGSTCLVGICLSTTSASCMATDYAVPDVPVGVLPGVAASTHVALSTLASGGSSPETPALDGALSYARGLTNSANKVAVVFFADGPWNVCPSGDAATGAASEVADVAARYATGAPAVLTYVIGIHGDADATYFDPIATAGGTGHAHVASSSAEILVALEAVRDAAKMSCP